MVQTLSDPSLPNGSRFGWNLDMANGVLACVNQCTDSALRAAYFYRHDEATPGSWQLLAKRSNPDPSAFPAYASWIRLGNGRALSGSTGGMMLFDEGRNDGFPFAQSYFLPSAAWGGSSVTDYTVDGPHVGVIQNSYATQLMRIPRMPMEPLHAEAANNLFRLSSGGVPGWLYELEHRSSLIDGPGWQPVTDAAADHHGNVDFVLPLPGNTGFYRLKHTPEE